MASVVNTKRTLTCVIASTAAAAITLHLVLLTISPEASCYPLYFVVIGGGLPYCLGVARRAARGDGGVGDALVDLPHELCPVDGVVLEGCGSMDESYLTGEPYQIDKTPGSAVMSGAINGEGVLVIKARKLAKDSRYASIMRVMADAESHRPDLRRLGDRLLSCGAMSRRGGLSMAEESVVYRIDGHDRITAANHEWDRFARDNSSEQLLFERITSRSLWDFISDTTTRFLYRDILKRVRSGHRVSFPFRCDSADCRRLLEMHMHLADLGAVEFEVRTLSLEKRPLQPLLESGRKRTDAFLRMCSWCKKIPDGDDWIEIEEAVAKMHLFDPAALPIISHGICEQCDIKMRDMMKASDSIRN